MAGFITSLRDNALIALGRAYAQINAARTRTWKCGYHSGRCGMIW